MSRVTPTGAAQFLCCLVLMGALGSAQLQAQTGTNPHHAHAQAHAHALWAQQMHMQFQNGLAQQMLQQHSALQSQQPTSPQPSLSGTQGSLGQHGQDPSVRKHLHGLYASPNQSAGTGLAPNQTSSLASLAQGPSSKQVNSPTIFSRLQPASQAVTSNTVVSSNRPANVAVNQGPGTGGASNPPTTAQQCQNQQSLLFRSQDSYTKIVLIGNRQQSQDPSGNVQNQCLQQQALLNRQTPTTTAPPQSQTILPTATQQRFITPVQPTTTTTSPVAPTASPLTTQQPITPVVGTALLQNSAATPSTSLPGQNLPMSLATSLANSQSGPTTGQSSGLPTGQGSPIMNILAQSIAQMLQTGAYSCVQIVNAQSIREFIATPQSNSSAPSSTNAPATFGSQN